MGRKGSHFPLLIFYTTNNVPEIEIRKLKIDL